MSSPHGPSVDLPDIKVARKRASTKVLLGDEYSESIDFTTPAPKPLKSAKDYDIPRVRNGLLYAESVLQNTERKLSPLGQQWIAIYKEACASYLDSEMHGIEDEMRIKYLSQIRGFDESLQYHACMATLKSDSAQELQDKILAMHQMQFYARYGDYFAEICKHVKLSAEKEYVEGWQRPSSRY